MGEGLDAFKSGQVAMMMNWFAFFPGLYKDPNVGGDKIGFFVNPVATRARASQLGGQGISVVSYSPNRNEALQYIKWFAQPDVQKKWWALGGYSCHKAVLQDPGFPKSAPFARRLPDRDGHGGRLLGRAELRAAAAGRCRSASTTTSSPTRAPPRKRSTACVVDWKKVFKEDGKLK